jgi:predicted Zn-dependent protease
VAALLLCSDTIRHPWQETIPMPIRAALESSSAVGLVLPGGENAAASRVRVYRGTGPAEDPQLDAALAASIERYESGHNGAAEAYTVSAGFMATGQLTAARDLVEEGLMRHPGDPRLLVLAADLAYRSSDLELSEQRLRAALSRRPRDPIATLDLALVLADRGREGEARRAFLSVIAEQPGTPLAERARRELARLQ